MKHSLLAACLLVSLACSPGSSGTDEAANVDWSAAPRQTRIPVGSAGTLGFLAPAGWEYEYKQQDVGKPVIHVRFRKDDHYVQLTGMVTGFEGKDRVKWARTAAENAGTERLSGSVEGSLAVENMSGAQTVGAYFTLTDKSLVGVSTLPDGEYRVMTQGAIAIGDLAVAFTVLGNDRDSALRRDALKMLTNATYSAR